MDSLRCLTERLGSM